MHIWLYFSTSMQYPYKFLFLPKTQINPWLQLLKKIVFNDNLEKYNLHTNINKTSKTHWHEKTVFKVMIHDV